MKGYLRTILGLACLSIPAYADNYTMQFTATDGIAPTSGSFTYDGTTFSNFLMEWDGVQFDLTAAANSPTVNTTPNCGPGASGPLASFDLLSLSVPGCPSLTFEWDATATASNVSFSFDSVDGRRDPAYFD